MYEEKGTIANLVHLYVDGAFNRRELISRVARHTGSMAAALAALANYEVLNAQPPSACPEGVRVPADAPDLVSFDAQYPGDGFTMLGYVSYPKTTEPLYAPGVIVIHENRGLVEHIRDVTRRMARAGFVAIAPDLLARQGGTGQFTEPTQQTQAYWRTTRDQRYSDLISTLSYLKSLPVTRHDRIGVTGYCAGGGNAWDFAANTPEILAAVPFYGAPTPVPEGLAGLSAAVLAIYAETDRALTARMAPVMTAMLDQRKTFGFIVYEGVGHAFHNDTGANYNAEAACDAWGRTIGWFNKFLRKP